MECDLAREAISARIDGEDPGLPDDVLDAQSLPQVKMPNQNGYALPEWKHGAPRIFPNKQ